VQNILNDPAVMVEVDGLERRAGARVLAGDSDEAELARKLVFDKYAPRSGDDLTDWRPPSAWGRTSRAAVAGRRWGTGAALGARQ
jgi:hypothetical protein